MEEWNLGQKEGPRRGAGLDEAPNLVYSGGNLSDQKG
jgi:hypothetical protein